MDAQERYAAINQEIVTRLAELNSNPPSTPSELIETFLRLTTLVHERTDLVLEVHADRLRALEERIARLEAHREPGA
jgi:hypothetical protein